jgi:hypothetical protein
MVYDPKRLGNSATRAVGAGGGTGAVMQAEASMRGEVFIVGTHI